MRQVSVSAENDGKPAHYNLAAARDLRGLNRLPVSSSVRSANGCNSERSLAERSAKDPYWLPFTSVHGGQYGGS